MATQTVPPAASTPPAGGSAYERISALTSGISSQFSEGSSSGESSATPESTPAESTPTPETTQTETAPAQTTQTETTQATPPAQTEQTPPNPYEQETVGSDIPQTVLDTFLQTPQGKEIIQNHRALTELAKPIDQGGIGHIPTIEQSRNYYLAFRDQVMMNGDLNSGNPQQLSRFFGHVFNPQRGEQANAHIASQIPAILAETPALYTAVMEPFLKHYQETLMERFKETKGYREGVDDQVADALWFAASILNNDLNGEYLTPEPSKAAPQNGAVLNTVDPKFAAERAKFEREKAAFEQQRQQSTQAHQNAWVNAYNGKVGELLMSELDQALQPLKQMYSTAPNTYNALRRQFHDEIVAALNSNRIGMELHNTNLGDAFRAGTLQSAHAIAEAYRDMARGIIRANRKRFLEGAGAAELNNNQQRHNEAAAIDGNRGARGGGGAMPSSPQNAPLQKEKDESQSDFILRMVRATTANAARALGR